MLKCENCKLFARLANTNETGQGICQFGNAWAATYTQHECSLMKEYHHTCNDCDRFGTDFACMTAAREDSADDCCGFIDKREADFGGLLFEWRMRGIDYHEKVETLLSEIDDYELPSAREN